VIGIETSVMPRQRGLRHTMLYRRFGKRQFDFICALLALIILLPIILVFAVLIRVKLGSPVIFRQKRPGRHGKLFTLFKLRSMTDARDSSGHLLRDSQRLGKFGRFLRASSVDELPELFNVLRGDMSLVGPRPLLVRYLPYFTSDERARFIVRPGITGLAQVSGRNDLSWNARLQSDIQYVNDVTFMGDIRILCATVLCVFRRDGYQTDPNASMLDFDAERELRLGVRDE